MSSEPFAEMARKIEHNTDSGFGGAYVIVAPDGSVKATLILNPDADAAQFWTFLKTACDISLAELAQQQGGQYARR